MAQSDINKEGLTFVEWVCAAGQAKFDSDSKLLSTKALYPMFIRKAWRSGEDPTEWRN